MFVRQRGDPFQMIGAQRVVRPAIRQPHRFTVAGEQLPLVIALDGRQVERDQAVGRLGRMERA